MGIQINNLTLECFAYKQNYNKKVFIGYLSFECISKKYKNSIFANGIFIEF